jgi:hypothetical protein
VTVAVDRAGSADNDDDPNRVEIILVKSPGPATRRRWRLTDGQETAPRFTSSYGLDGGGGAGEYGEIIITSPSATYIRLALVETAARLAPMRAAWADEA